MSLKATISRFGLQTGTDRTVYAEWQWSKENTKEYKVLWTYGTGDYIAFIGDESTTMYRNSTFSAPQNAERVRFKIKPVAKTHKVNGKDVAYWTADWSNERVYEFSSNPPTSPSAPNVTIENNRLTARIDVDSNINATSIEFQIVKDDSTVYKTGIAKIVTNTAIFSCDVANGSEYKARCRAIRGSLKSEWSPYSGNSGTKPSAPSGIKTCKGLSSSSIYLEWYPVAKADTYEIEYTTNRSYMDSSNATTSISSIEQTNYTITGLTSGSTYFFRVRAVNESGNSDWSGIKSVTIGIKPDVPTTWSSTTTGIVGESIILYWVHNSLDNSKQRYAQIELTINGSTQSPINIDTTQQADNEDDTNQSQMFNYTLSTSSYTQGSVILWRVRTQGISGEYSDWSVQRTIDIYARPTMELHLRNMSGSDIYVINSFPFVVYSLVGPNTQAPTGYHVSIVANDSYDDIDRIGNEIKVASGEVVFSRYYDTTMNPLLAQINAWNINLKNNVSYTLTCTASMNSGLTAVSSQTFSVTWSDDILEPNAEIGIDESNYSAVISPYCEDSNGDRPQTVKLSVYRREFDGGFTEIASNLSNNNTYIVDPHPPLDYARYRIIAVTESTGAVSFYDIPAYPVGGKAIIIQWDEKWTSFDSLNGDELNEQPLNGSMLTLPYNIDISDSNDVDMELVGYVGRSHPVAYYGTQLGVTSTWNTDIPATDVETLYALRRLSKWMGNVYVREPSGSGYWASIKVSFSKKHLDTVIPVTLSITRVEGGI